MFWYNISDFVMKGIKNKVFGTIKKLSTADWNSSLL